MANQILVKARWPTVSILNEEGADYFEADEDPRYCWATESSDGVKEFIRCSRWMGAAA